MDNNKLTTLLLKGLTSATKEITSAYWQEFHKRISHLIKNYKTKNRVRHGKKNKN
jgi:hypothetical protein